MTYAPDGVRVRVEFTPGTWTDVTGYVDWSAGCSTSAGKSGRYSDIDPSKMSVTLFNDDGRFTPGRQVLADGSTPHPYWPNVRPRVRIQRDLLVAGTWYPRFTGYVKGWPPGYKDFGKPRVTVVAEDRLARLARVSLGPSIRSEVLYDKPVAYWPFNDPTPDTGVLPVGVEQAGATSRGNFVTTGSPPTPTPGQPGVTAADGTSFGFTSTAGAFPMAARVSLPLPPSTFAFWINFAAVSTFSSIISLRDVPVTSDVTVYSSNSGQLSFGGSGASAALADGRWHHVAVRCLPSSTELWVDGTFVLATSTGAGRFDQVVIWSQVTSRLAQMAYFPTALSATRLAAHYRAGQTSGEFSDDRVARYLRLAGVAAADCQLDDSSLRLGTAPQDGKDVVSAINDVTVSEAGNSIFFADPSGLLRFTSRGTPITTVSMTLDSAADIEGDDFDPTFGDGTLVNQVTGSRATESDTAYTYTAIDQASIDAYDLFTGSPFTTYTLSNDDTRYAVQDRLSRNRQPAARLESVSVDLRTAEHNFYPQVAALRLGARVRLTNLPSTQPAAMMDFEVEGYTERLSDLQYVVTLQLSPADNPAPLIWGNDTYDRWQCNGQTLQSTISSAATSLQIASPAGAATFTTDPTMYPLKITVGAERIVLTAPPSGSTSPQNVHFSRAWH